MIHNRSDLFSAHMESLHDTGSVVDDSKSQISNTFFDPPLLEEDNDSPTPSFSSRSFGSRARANSDVKEAPKKLPQFY